MHVVERLPSRISHILRPWAMLCPDHPAILEAGRVWTYSDLAEAVAETKLWLVNQHVGPGDRVMIVNENCFTAAALLLALGELDAWAVPVSARLSAAEIEAIRRHCTPRCMVFTIAAAPQARALAAQFGAVTMAFPTSGQMPAPIALLACTESGAPEPVETDGSRQVAVLIYTSGTTGTPKGVMLTHHNLLFVAAASGTIRSVTPGDRFYGVMPIAHIVGISVALLSTLMFGASLALTPRFDPRLMLEALERDRPTILVGVPATYALMLDYARGRGITRLRHQLRLIAACGAPLDLAIKTGAESLFGMPLHNGYGTTECAPTVAQTRIEAPRGDCAIGPPIPGIDVRILRPDGAEAAPGEVGALFVRGPNVMKGYYRNSPATEAVLGDDGWFNTCDLARMEEGCLFIAGRAKELIIRFGFNVYPPEIEAVLNAHPAVVQSAVIGRTVPGNEEIIAYVQLRAGSATPADLAKFAASRLAAYKRPCEIIILPALPAGPTGKILKSKLGRK